MKKHTHRKRTFFVRLMLQITSWILLALILGITMVVVMSITIGQAKTHIYFLELYRQQLNMSEPYQYNQLLNMDANLWIQASIDKLQHILTVKTNAYGWLTNHFKIANAYQGKLVYLDQFILTTIIMVQIIIVRLCILLLAMPLVFLFSIIGIVDGLMQRDLRKWGGGRESTLLFHKAKGSVVRLFSVIPCLYLIAPIALSPTYILLPFAIVVGYLLSVLTRTFKKYVYV